MACTQSLLALAVLAFLSFVNADAIYTKKSPVLQVDSKSYDNLIASSNHTSVSAATPSSRECR